MEPLDWWLCLAQTQDTHILLISVCRLQRTPRLSALMHRLSVLSDSTQQKNPTSRWYERFILQIERWNLHKDIALKKTHHESTLYHMNTIIKHNFHVHLYIFLDMMLLQYHVFQICTITKTLINTIEYPVRWCIYIWKWHYHFKINNIIFFSVILVLFMFNIFEFYFNIFQFKF